MTFEEESIQLQGPLYLILSLLASSKLPFLQISENLRNTIDQHVRTDEGARNGIKYINDVAKDNLMMVTTDIQICLDRIANYTEVMAMFSLFSRPFFPILHEVKKCIRNRSLNGTSDFSSLFRDLDPDLTDLENAHRKMKKVAAEILDGKDLYAEYHTETENLCLKSLARTYAGEDVATLMTIAGKINFNLKRIINLSVLYFHDMSINDIMND